MRRLALPVLLAWLVCAFGARAAHADTAVNQKVQADISAAFAAARKTAILGPANYKLLDQASLALTPDEVFIPAADANRIMTAMGNQASPQRFGLIVSRAGGARWLIDVKWTREGYVRDGDAKAWKADALLKDLKDGTEQGNADRLARGIPALDVVGWIEPPAYEPVAHRLVWSLALSERGTGVNEPRTVNYNTYALGRDGYFSLDLITGSDRIAADKQVVRDLLGSLKFGSGKRYEDFNGSTDKVAAYGLAALVGVIAVKKLGLLAVASAFLFKAWKLGLVALAAAAAAVRRFFKKPANGAPS